MSIEGQYNVTVKTPVGAKEGSLKLIVDGDTLSGVLTNPKGATEFTGGTVSGDEIAFETKIRTPMGRLKAQVSGRVDGRTFTGTAKLPLGVAHITGTRV